MVERGNFVMLKICMITKFAGLKIRGISAHHLSYDIPQTIPCTARRIWGLDYSGRFRNLEKGVQREAHPKMF